MHPDMKFSTDLTTRTDRANLSCVFHEPYAMQFYRDAQPIWYDNENFPRKSGQYAPHVGLNDCSV
ncbi:MAG: hypothetical protein DHS20C01_20330 [marine bacterium B5-7]|nr:MAG: hypothetical protein DHS20C01_20330 [marine bacterium B5-7]